jgi:hypothetical protein
VIIRTNIVQDEYPVRLAWAVPNLILYCAKIEIIMKYPELYDQMCEL